MNPNYPESLDDIEFADNPEPRCTCVILVDTSGSMGGEPIAKMNEALQVFASEIKRDSLTARRVDAVVIAEQLNDPEPIAYITLAAAYFAYWFAKKNGAAAGKEFTRMGIAAYFRQIKEEVIAEEVAKGRADGVSEGR